MSKSSRPDRRKKGRGKREPKEFEEFTLAVDRVTRVVAGGRRLRFRAVVIVGNKKGKVGLGTGKANEVQSAVRKAADVAKRNMIRIPIVNGTIPHEVDVKYKAARIRLIPAREGTGVIAGGALRPVLEHAGIKNVLSKRFGTTNKLVNAQAIMLAFSKLRGEIKDEPTVDKTAEAAPEALKVTAVSKKDVSAEGTLEVKKSDKTAAKKKPEADKKKKVTAKSDS